MSKPFEQPRSRLLENSLLGVAAMFAHAPLYYQLPRWVDGLDPTYVPPYWLERSSFPIILYMAAVPPVVWILVLLVIFARVCWNYGWRLIK